MEIKINPAWPVSDIGGKPNQEDRIYPYKEYLKNGLPADTRCFVLCDGMGGHEHGEVAAEIVSHTLQPALTKSATTPDVMTVDRFNKALRVTYAELDKMPVSEGKRPGTTMTCVYLAENGVFVAHIGDSRIYQVRPGAGIVFRTVDHSLVNELVKAGEITEEEAAHHPRRNIITRAMQPGLETPFNAETQVITDVKAGDYFFMCSDGVLENLTDEKLVEILSKDITDKEKLDEIFVVCFGRTRDNFSAVLIPIASVTGKPLATPAPESIKPLPANVVTPASVSVKPRPEVTPTQTAKPRKSSKVIILVVTTLIIIAAIAAAAYFIGFKTGSDESKTAIKSESSKTNESKSDAKTKPEFRIPVKGHEDEADDDTDDDDDDVKKNKNSDLEDLAEAVEDAGKDKEQNQNTGNDKVESSPLGAVSATKLTEKLKDGKNEKAESGDRKKPTKPVKHR